MATLTHRLMHSWFLVSRPMTLGARAIVLDRTDRVLLVRHTYVEGWHLPGGGVEPGETAIDCVRREVREEGNVEIAGEVVLHGFYHNQGASRRDHVALYVCRVERHLGPKVPDREIAAADFFATDSLPDTVADGTRRRLEEWRSGARPAPRW